MRFIKQKTKTSCVPIAVINILKVLGVSNPSQYLSQLNDLLSYDYRLGVERDTSLKTIPTFLRSRNAKCITRRKSTCNEIDTFLDKDYKIIMFYDFHAVVLIKNTPKGYWVVNRRPSSSTLSWIKRSIYEEKCENIDFIAVKNNRTNNEIYLFKNKTK